MNAMNVKIKEIFGPLNASESENDRLAYSTDASRMPGEALMVVHPVSKEQVYKFVQYARRGRMDIVPRGAGTGIVGGAVPQGSVVMDMSKMNRVLEVGDGYVKLEAGAIFSEVNELLAERGVHIPLVSEVNSKRTIGGMIATNAVGLRVLEHGRMEDWVEEVEMVDGTGRMAKLLRDEAKSVCGTEGTVGVIVGAKIRTLPLLAGRSLSVLEFNTITAMLEKIEELKSNGHVKMMIYLDEICSGVAGLEPNIHLFVEYDNDEGSIKNDSEVESAISIVDSLDGLMKANKKIVREDPKVPLNELGKFLNWLRKYNIPAYANVDVGLVHPYFPENAGYEISELYKVVKSVNGSVGWEHGLGLLKKGHADPDRRRRAEVLKQHYDPTNLMNRGKMI